MADHEHIRPAFEDRCWQHYMAERERRDLRGDVPDAFPTREQLFWRMPDGRYGVLMFNAAWMAWCWALEAEGVPDVENMLLRQMLAIRVAGGALYSDDGELQDNSAHPCIDFRRDPAHLIHYKLKARLSASPAAAQQGSEPWSDQKQAELNDWFLSLSEGRQAALLQDKWTLAGAAFEAGRALAAASSAPVQQERKPMTDENDRALCEAYCNTASDEYFKARPQLDSEVNRRIFYAGHRKAWIEKHGAAIEGASE